MTDASAWNTACPDWEHRLKHGTSLIPTLPLIDKEATRAVAIFNNLCLPDVPGNPRLEIAAGPWFRDIVAAVAGSYDPDANIRYIREFFALVPKKNSKTSYSAGLMLALVMMSRRPRSEYILIAPTIEIANIAFAQAVGMVELDPVLRQKFHSQDHLRSLTYRPTGAKLKVKAFDTKVVTGSKPAGILIDELHVISEYHNADRVIGQLRGGLISQAEGFLMTITTQSERPPAGVFKNELQKARAVRDGQLIAPVLPILYEFPQSMDWRNPSNWPMILPNLGRSIHIGRMIEDFNIAKASSDDEFIRWCSQHLNVQVGISLTADAWAGASFWIENAERFTLEALIERSDTIQVGIDGGGLDDMLGLCILGRDESTGDWLSFCRAWIHPIALERRKSEKAKYIDFADAFELTISENVGDDVVDVVALVMQCEASGKLDKVGVDPVGVASIVDALEAAGIDRERIVGIPQGWRLAGAIKAVERRLAQKTLKHNGTSLMSWCVGNAKVETRGNAIMVTKQISGTAKIDPLCALFDAAALMSLASPALTAADIIG